MSIAAINWALEVKTKTPMEKLVLVALANYADETGKCWPSVKRIAQICGCTERYVTKAISRLKKEGIIIRRDRAGTSITQLPLNHSSAGTIVHPEPEFRCQRNHSSGGAEPEFLSERNHSSSKPSITTNEPPMNHQSCSPQADERATDLFGDANKMPAAKPTKKQKPPVDDDPMFVQFWSDYPRKICKGDARKGWKTVVTTKTLALDAIAGIREFEEGEWADRPVDKIPYPGTFLRKFFEDWKGASSRVAGNEQEPEREKSPYELQLEAEARRTPEEREAAAKANADTFKNMLREQGLDVDALYGRG